MFCSSTAVARDTSKELNPQILERLENDSIQKGTACLPIIYRSADQNPKQLTALQRKTKAEMQKEKGKVFLTTIAYDLYLPAVKDPKVCQTKGLIILANFAKNQSNQRNDGPSATGSGTSFKLLQDIAKGLQDKGYITAIVYHHANQGDKETLIKNISAVRSDIKASYSYIQKNNTFYVGSSFSGFAIADNAFWDSRIKDHFNGLVLLQSGMYRQGITSLTLPLISYVCKNDITATSENHVGGVAMYNQLPLSIQSKSKGFTDQDCSGHNVNLSWANPVVADVTQLFR